MRETPRTRHERPGDSRSGPGVKRILYVAFPMVVITASVAGGAEQMLWTLEQEISDRGHHSAVAACSGSQVAGQLVVTGSAPEVADTFAERKVEHEMAVLSELRRAS